MFGFRQSKIAKRWEILGNNTVPAGKRPAFASESQRPAEIPKNCSGFTTKSGVEAGDRAGSSSDPDPAGRRTRTIVRKKPQIGIRVWGEFNSLEEINENILRQIPSSLRPVNPNNCSQQKKKKAGGEPPANSFFKIRHSENNTTLLHRLLQNLFLLVRFP